MKKGVITLVDILGWKGIWQREEDPVKKLKDFIGGLNNAINTVKKESNMLSELKISIHSISDTIAIITYCDNASVALKFHALVNCAVVAESIKRNIPMRGATSYGDLSIEGNIMVGPAVDEVAEWYEAANWIGIIQAPSALFLTNSEDFGEYKNFLKKYPVPVKGIGTMETYCVNWPKAWQRNDCKEGLIKKFSEMGTLSPLVAKKYENTLKFYEYCSSDEKNQ